MIINRNKQLTKHNKYNSRIYRIWRGMKDRCYNINSKDYKNYGGRGIVVCDEWLNDFMSFYNWSMNNGYDDSLTIDRIDVNGNYEPSNCRWVTQKQQQRNRRNNKLFTYNGEVHYLSEWCELLHLNQNTIYNRINNLNYSIERALELEEI